MAITIEQAIESNMTVGQLLDASEQAEDWAPEQRHWKTMKHMDSRQLTLTLDFLLAQWMMNPFIRNGK